MQIILLAVTLISLTAAVVMSVVAWRLIRVERLRSDARIAALAAEITADDRPVAAVDPDATVVTGPQVRRDAPASVRLGPPASLPTAMFADARPPHSGFRMVAAVGAGALVVATVIGVLIMTSGRRDAPAPAARGASAPEPAAATATEAALELVALGHQRETDRLTVRGVVRNASATAEVNRLAAVVLLFGRDGGFVASGRADVDGAAVAPGAERTFVVSVPTGVEIARYRVSFRREERVVPHIDRRNLKPGI